MKNPFSKTSDALSANGSQTHRANGIAAIAIIPSSSLIVAEHTGTLLKHAVYAPDACINGVGHHAFTAANGRRMKIGM